MLLSDRDIKAEVAADRVQIDPYDEGMIQPSSIDVRLDRWFRVFENHKYPHIDPSVEQPDLTRLIEPEGDEPFILHPGEFGCQAVGLWVFNVEHSDKCRQSSKMFYLLSTGVGGRGSFPVSFWGE